MAQAQISRLLCLARTPFLGPLRLIYVETNPGWLELSLAGPNFHGPKHVLEPLKFYCILFFFANHVTVIEETLCAKLVHLQLIKTVLV